VKLAQEITEEGRHAIESPSSPVLPNLGPEGYLLGELSSIVFRLLHFVVFKQFLFVSYLDFITMSLHMSSGAENRTAYELCLTRTTFV